MSQIIAGVAIPQTDAAAAATRLVEASVSPLLFHHSRRVYVFGTFHAQRLNLDANPELLYIASLFHDTGLVPPYATPEQRFELDGADKARRFLLERDFSADEARTVWEAIALHTSPGIPTRMSPVIATMHLGVLTDALGFGLGDLDQATVDAVLAAHPRDDFKNGFIQAFHEGIQHRPDTTYGNLMSDVLVHFDPAFKRGSMVESILTAPWTE
jgi:hypothetical protein